MSCLEGCRPVRQRGKDVTSSPTRAHPKCWLTLPLYFKAVVVSISCSFIKRINKKIGQALGSQWIRLVLTSICVFRRIQRSQCTQSSMKRGSASELEVLRQHSSGAGLERRRQTTETKVSWRWSQAFVKSECHHRHHCKGQDGLSEQQHTEEPMALGGIRSRSSSSGISSSR